MKQIFLRRGLFPMNLLSQTRSCAMRMFNHKGLKFLLPVSRLGDCIKTYTVTNSSIISVTVVVVLREIDTLIDLFAILLQGRRA